MPRRGVSAKIRVVPVAVNTSRYDPAATVPARLPRGSLVFGQQRLLRGVGLEERGGEAARGGQDSAQGGQETAQGEGGSSGGGGAAPFVFVSTFKWEMRKGWDRRYSNRQSRSMSYLQLVVFQTHPCPSGRGPPSRSSRR